MEFAYSPRLADLKERARALTDTIMQFEDECERNNGISDESHATIKAAVLASGLQAINTPVEYGGAGETTVLEQAVVQDELGQFTNALWDTVWRPANPLTHATPEQRERYLIPGARGDRRDAVAISEANAGSDFSAASTTATPDGNGGYIINGEKWFVTVGDVADYLIVLANVEPEHAATIFLIDVDTPGVKIKHIPRYTHTFVYEHPEFTFENVRVGADAVLGGIGQGHDLTRDWFTEERLMIGARTIGAAERALTLAVDWARERVQGGEPLINRQLIQGMIADSDASNRPLHRCILARPPRSLDVEEHLFAAQDGRRVAVAVEPFLPRLVQRVERLGREQVTGDQPNQRGIGRRTGGPRQLATNAGGREALRRGVEQVQAVGRGEPVHRIGPGSVELRARARIQVADPLHLVIVQGIELLDEGVEREQGMTLGGGHTVLPASCFTAAAVGHAGAARLSGRTQDPSRARAGVTAGLDHHLTADDDPLDPIRRAPRLLYVAFERTRSGSKATRSATYPSRIRPRSLRPRRAAAPDVIDRTASSRDTSASSRTNCPRTRGNDPYVRGDGLAPTNVESVPIMPTG